MAASVVSTLLCLLNSSFSCFLYHFWHYTWQFCSLSIFYLTDWLFYRVFFYWARYAGNCICLGQTIPVPCKLYVQKLFIINFPSSFPFLSIKILLNNDMLISFDHRLCNLKHIAFLIIPLHNIFKSFPFCFLHLAWKTVSLPLRAYFSHLLCQYPPAMPSLKNKMPYSVLKTPKIHEFRRV